jgi:BsuBI/PstI restriction endonuclease domain
MINQKNTALRYISGDAFTFAAPGPQRYNSLLVDTIELFGPRYTPHAFILHFNDCANMISIHEQEQLYQLGIYASFEHFSSDIILYQEKKQAIFFIEVATSRGIITHQRKHEIEEILAACPLRRVYITACYNLYDYEQFVEHVAWGSYIWCAQIPDHIIFHW